MKNLNKFWLILLCSSIVLTAFIACSDDDDGQPTVVDNDDNDDDDGDDGGSSSTTSTPITAFDDFDDDVTITFDGNEIIIESDGTPNHTSPYWDTSNVLNIDPIIADEAQMSPGVIREGSYSLTVPSAPELASSSSATGLGAIGIAISGVPIFNDEEGPNIQLSAAVASGFDYAGGHNGPTGYHYHLEAQGIDENTMVSFDDDALVGIMEDGFLLYGRRCNSTGDYPTDLDESGGHLGVTQHSNGVEFYHYHIINEVYEGIYYLLFGEDLQGTPQGVNG